jgi:beta-fructofuranosidase
MLDEKGRRILFANLNEGRGMDVCQISGWYGVMSLPVVISLAAEGNAICYEPATELQALRHDLQQRLDIDIETDTELALPEVRGDCLELELEMEPRGAAAFGLKVRCAPDGSEETVVSTPARSAPTSASDPSSCTSLMQADGRRRPCRWGCRGENADRIAD